MDKIKTSNRKLAENKTFIGFKYFYDNCDDIRNERNDFIHDTPWALSIETADKAFDVARDTIKVCTGLRNTFRKPLK